MSVKSIFKLEIQSIEEWLEFAPQFDSCITDYTKGEPIVLKYSQLVEEIKKQARKWSELGINPGCTVLLSEPSSSSLVIQILSLMSIGAAPVPVSNLLSKESYRYICENIKPAAIYTSTKGKFFSDLGFSLSTHDFIGNHSLFVCKGEKPCNKELEYSFVLTTSGSTGFPKSVVHKNKSAFLNASLHMEAIKETEIGNGTYISSLPFFFSYGLVAGIIGALIKGKNIIIPEQPFYPTNWTKHCIENNVTLSSITPGVLKKILNLNCEIPACLKTITIGGEQADLSDIRLLQSKFQGDIFLTYGLSEAGPRVATNHVNTSIDLSFMGEPLTNIEMKLINSKVQENYEIGDLVVKTPTAMQGYLIKGNIYRDNEFLDEWLLTGDICKKMNDTNYFIYMERKKNTIKCGGENIYPGIIRKVLLEHPDIEEAKIESEKDEKLGGIPIAYIKLKKGRENLPDLREWCKSRLRLIEIPRKFIPVEELYFFKK